MNRIVFYGGLILVAFSIVMWFFRPNNSKNKNRIKAFGMEFNLSTPEFIITVFGIIMMIVSVNFPSVFAPPPPPPSETNNVEIRSAIYQSKYTPRKSCGFSYASRICNNTSRCNLECSNSKSDCNDPDKGTEKRCIIDYACSRDPNNVRRIDVGDSNTRTFDIVCQ